MGSSDGILVYSRLESSVLWTRCGTDTRWCRERPPAKMEDEMGIADAIAAILEAAANAPDAAQAALQSVLDILNGL
jgi:hypothetical protein